MKVLKQSIEKRDYEESMNEIIENAILVIKFFYDKGEERKISKNPFLVKL